MKECTKCGELKELSMFVTLNRSKDGKSPICKKCKSIYMHKYRKTYIRKEGVNYNKDYWRDYYIKNKDKIKEKVKKYRETEGGKLSTIRGSKKYCKKHPKRRKINTNLSVAIIKGDIVRRPCEICESLEVNAHHDDYNKPMDVRWLCPQHHRDWHKKNKPIEAL